MGFGILRRPSFMICGLNNLKSGHLAWIFSILSMSCLRTGCPMFTGALMKSCAAELCSCDGVRCKISAGDIESLTWSVGEKRAVFMVNVSLNDNSYASSISLILGPVMAGGVITDALKVSSPSHEHEF